MNDYEPATPGDDRATQQDAADAIGLMLAAANDREAFADALKTLTIHDAGRLLVAALEVCASLLSTSDKALAQGVDVGVRQMLTTLLDGVWDLPPAAAMD